MPQHDYWRRAMRELGARSWEECLTPEERLGGPSRMGSSKYDAFKRGCPYLYWWKYIRRMKRTELDENLEIGGLFHEVRARYYQTEMDLREREDQQHIDEACVEAGYELLRRAEEVAPAISGVVRRLWKGWLALRGPGTPDDDRDQTVAVELLLEVTEPFLYTTRLDRVTINDGPDPTYNICEIKTARAYTTRLRQSYRMDSQFLGQQFCWIRGGGVEKFGRVKHHIIDLAIKTNPAQYPMEIAPIVPELLRDWIYETEYVWRRIQFHMRSLKQWPRNRTYHCRFCEAFDHCASNGRDLNGWVPKRKDDY